jgi:hypothetical protein
MNDDFQRTVNSYWDHLYAQVDRSPKGQDREDGLDRNDESAVRQDAPKPSGSDPEQAKDAA